MTLQQIAKWNSQQNPLEKVLGLNSICPTITTRVAESIGGGINASTILVCEQLDNTSNLRDLYLEGGSMQNNDGICPTLTTNSGNLGGCGSVTIITHTHTRITN